MLIYVITNVNKTLWKINLCIQHTYIKLNKQYKCAYLQACICYNDINMMQHFLFSLYLQSIIHMFVQVIDLYYNLQQLSNETKNICIVQLYFVFTSQHLSLPIQYILYLCHYTPIEQPSLLYHIMCIIVRLITACATGVIEQTCMSCLCVRTHYFASCDNVTSVKDTYIMCTHLHTLCIVTYLSSNITIYNTKKSVRYNQSL